jgi:molybdate transport system substrate-binding protein
MRLTTLGATLCAWLAACTSDRPAGKPAGPVTIFAASSLKELVTELADGWSRTTGRATRLQFESSSTLARQIKEGAPADVFITAAPEWLDPLTLVKRFDWLSNRLVVVVGKDVQGEVDLRSVESLAMASEQVPAGKYARAALEKLGITPPARTIYGSSVRDVLSKVSQGGAQAGIVYATDAAVDPAVRIAFSFPEDSHPKILYSVGVMTPDGEEFAAVLSEPASLAAATRRGFTQLE